MAKERPILFSTPMVQAIMQGRKTQTRRVVKEPFQSWINDAENPEWWLGLAEQCPYGQPDDVLWVREGFTWLGKKEDPIKYLYKAEPTHDSMRWKPSIHMPKDAARIWLRIIDVRVEKLQDISDADAIAEGAPAGWDISAMSLAIASSSAETKKKSLPPLKGNQLGFLGIWAKINGLDNWFANPWVWVVGFEVLSTTGRKDVQP